MVAAMQMADMKMRASILNQLSSGLPMDQTAPHQECEPPLDEGYLNNALGMIAWPGQTGKI